MEQDLRGISVCPVWQAYSATKYINDWTPDDVHVVGVQTSVYRNAIKATRWWAVSHILWQAYPELRKHLNLNGHSLEEIEKNAKACSTS
jgi:hypothetical protein